MAGLAVSQSFIDDLCKNLQFALDLTSRCTNSRSDDSDKIHLDSHIWTAIVDSHIATLNTHKAIIERLATDLQGSTSKASAQALQKLQRGASLAIAGAREAKLALAREKILEEVDDILPGDTKHTKAPIPTNTQIKRKRSPSTQRPSKIAKSTHPTSEAIPPTTPPVPGADASEPVDTTMTDSPITTSEPLKSEPSPVPDDAAQQSVPSPAFYDINAEVDEAMETAAEARKRQRKRDEGEIEKRKRESTGSMTALSVHADAVAGSIRTSVAKRRRISPEVDISGSSRGRRKRGVEEYSLEKELLSTPKQVRAGP